MNKKSKKILVTGVAGFLGSHLSEQLAKMGHKVIGIDNKNAILLESTLLKFKNLAAVKVIPALLTPGINASI